MAKAIGIIAVLVLVGCGVDAPPTPPGQENSRVITDVDQINPSGYF